MILFFSFRPVHDLALLLRRALPAFAQKFAALKRIKWKYLFAFLFGSGGMACCGMATNIWMEMMIPLLLSLVDTVRFGQRM